MRTITYTYDEQKPTNKDYIIACLTESIDDGGASYESMTRYNINCPYFGNDDCLNEHEGNTYDTKEYNEACVRCKLAWLNRQYDTYPSEDGVWETQESEGFLSDNTVEAHKMAIKALEQEPCEEKQDQTRDEKMIDAIDFAIKATDSQDDYSMGMRNGMRYVKSLIDGKEPQYEIRRTDEEMKLGIYIGDEVVSDYGAKGVVVGIDTYKGRPWLSLLMKNHKVPQLVDASEYKTKTGRHFPQIIEVLEQIKGESEDKE